jgi:hypothetical protein
MGIKGLLRIALLALVVMLVQGTWVLAGTTGSISGSVTDQTGAPVAGVKITATSPSQSASVTTDAKGFYAVLNLSPDTYSVTASKTGFDVSTLYGLTVTADQDTNGDMKIHPTVSVLGHITATAQAGVVSKTVTGDLYAVNATKISGYQGSSGGAESLYSQNGVVGSLPGVVRAVGQGGTYNGQGTLSLRGGSYDQVGFELEGIPLNRGFDFYNSSALATNGLASVEVYTGGAPADSGRAMSGFINGTIQRGRYPGGAEFDGSFGGQAFAHALHIAMFGGTPDNRFSYYISSLSNDQSYLYGDRSNQDNTQISTPANDPGCPFVKGNFGGTLDCTVGHTFNIPMGESFFANNALPYNQSRDTTANLHWTLTHNGLSDDVQALAVMGATGGPFPYSGANLDPNFYAFETGGGTDPVTGRILWPIGNPYTGTLNASYDPTKLGAYTWPTAGGSKGPVPLGFFDSQSTVYNIEKLGYTRSLTDTSFVRLFAYSLFSAWNLDEPTEGLNGGTFYQLHDNATGLSLNYQNQVNRQNLIKFDADYSKDLTLRYNYANWLISQSQGLSVNAAGGYVQCGDLATATFVACAPGQNVASINSPYAYWSSTTPITTDAVLADTFKPSDKFNFDIGVRYDQFKFGLMPLQINGPNGMAEQSQNRYGVCLDGYAYAVGEPCNGFLTARAGIVGNPKLLPGAAAWQDVNGSLVFNEFSPRFGVTFAADPSNVFRASVGRYVQPPNSAFEEYRAAPQFGVNDTVAVLNRFYGGLGFLAVHNVQPEDSTNYDVSYEHDFSGGLSFKVTPYARVTRGQVLNLPVNPSQPSFVTGYNFGNARIHGAEFLMQKNRTSENGLSATLAGTYTDSKIHFGPAANGVSIIGLINTQIAAYNTANGTHYAMEDPNAYYSPSFTQAPPATSSYDVKWVWNLNLDERMNGWDFSPTFNYQSGNPYGDPLDFGGNPDPYTHTFDAFGSLQGPSWVTMNMGISHDLSSKSKVGVLFTNLFTSVSNHGYPWEYPSKDQVIGYSSNPFYALNAGISPGYVGESYYPYVPTSVSPYHGIIVQYSTKM